MALVHLTTSTVGRVRITRSPSQLLAVVRALARTDRLLFAVVDDHVHVVDRAERPAHRLRDLNRAIRAACPKVPLQPGHVQPVTSRRHLERLVGYLLEQPTKHGLAEAAALWPGSCFLDLVGARRLPGFELEGLLDELPRLRLRQLFPHVGLQPLPLRPLDSTELRQVDPAGLVRAAAAVLVLPTPVGDRSRAATLARALALRAAQRAGIRPRDIVPLLGLSSRAARKLASRKLDPALLDTLGRRLSLERRVARTAEATPAL